MSESEINKAWVELKGDLANAIDDLYCVKTHLIKRISSNSKWFKVGDYVLSSHGEPDQGNWEVICTTQQFTDYCEMMNKQQGILGKHGCVTEPDSAPVFTQETYDNLVDRIMQFNRCIGQIADYLRVSTSGVDVSGDDPTICATAEDIINGIKKSVNYDKHPCMDWMPSRDSECLFSYGGSEWRSCKYIGKLTVGSKSYAVLFVHESACYDNFKFCSDLKFKPIQPSRNEAIKKMRSDTNLRSRDGADEVCGEFYDANYRKLTPEQARMYDDKTGFFGENYK